MAAGVAQIPWYATLFRGDRFAEALAEIAPVAMRYGATDYLVYRNRDDMYKFTQCATFESKADFEAYWYGPEMTATSARSTRAGTRCRSSTPGPTSSSRAAERRPASHRARGRRRAR